MPKLERPIPVWGLSEPEAARAVGLSVNTFKKYVSMKVFPEAKMWGGRKIYHADQVKEAFDKVYDYGANIDEWQM